MKIIKSIFVLASIVILATLATNSYFTSQARIEGNVFSTGFWSAKIVINEVYYQVDSRTYGHGEGVKTEREGYNEWIELYNPNDFDVNIKDYKIGNSDQEFTIHPNVSIEAHGFALLSHDNDTWHFWGDPDALTINLGGSVGDGWLINTGDWVYLKDKDETIVDEMSYGDNTTAFSPPCPIVAVGHSLERNPDGQDTNTSVDFIDRVNPTPGI